MKKLLNDSIDDNLDGNNDSNALVSGNNLGASSVNPSSPSVGNTITPRSANVKPAKADDAASDDETKEEGDETELMIDSGKKAAAYRFFTEAITGTNKT